MSPQRVEKFRKTVLDYYKKYGRDLPWRQTKDPYHILVSEIMLQQTQVARAMPKYEAFLKRFPSLKALDEASTGDVLKSWQGLGYNRRALALKKIAAQLKDGIIPKEPELLEQLPGIGHYTARAIAAFAYNRKGVCIETNIRRVFLHHFFPGKENIADDQLWPYVEQTLPQRDVRTWYWALMDYGSWLATQGPNPNRRSKLYVRQSKFEGSVRQVRGEIVKLLVQKAKYSREQLVRAFGSDVRVVPALAGLLRDGLIKETKRHIVLA